MGYPQPPLDSGTPTINKGFLAEKGPQPPLVWWVGTEKPPGSGEPEGAGLMLPVLRGYVPTMLELGLPMPAVDIAPRLGLSPIVDASRAAT